VYNVLHCKTWTHKKRKAGGGRKRKASAAQVNCFESIAIRKYEII
jgi:hypothetical protein